MCCTKYRRREQGDTIYKAWTKYARVIARDRATQSRLKVETFASPESESAAGVRRRVHRAFVEHPNADETLNFSLRERTRATTRQLEHAELTFFAPPIEVVFVVLRVRYCVIGIQMKCYSHIFNSRFFVIIKEELKYCFFGRGRRGKLKPATEAKGF